jgi:hypothetical protein
MDAAQCVVDDQPVTVAAQDQPEAEIVAGLTLEIVQGRQIEIRLASMLWMERPRLEINGGQAAQLAVVGQEIDVEMLPPTSR